MKVFELIPNNGRKSFYGKAKVIDSDNGIVSLVSYDTIVCSIDTNKKEFIRHWNSNSMTTTAHINSFRSLYGYRPLTSAQWKNLPVIPYNK